MLGQIGASLVEGASGDLCAVAQSRDQLAVVDDETPEGGFGGARRPAIIPDFPQNLIRASGSCLTLVFPAPHGDLSPRGVIPLLAFKGQPSTGADHKPSRQRISGCAARRLR